MYQERLEVMLRRLELRSQLYRQPERPEDQAAMIIEQVLCSSLLMVLIIEQILSASLLNYMITEKVLLSSVSSLIVTDICNIDRWI